MNPQDILLKRVMALPQTQPPPPPDANDIAANKLIAENSQAIAQTNQRQNDPNNPVNMVDMAYKTNQASQQLPGPQMGGAAPQTVKIRNNATGEVREVPADQLGQYGITKPIDPNVFIQGAEGQAQAQSKAGDIAGQTITKNENEIAKENIDLQISDMQKDQTLAPKVLAIDLQNGMTLSDAMHKYAGHGLMKGDQVVSQYDAYNANNPKGYGAHKETPAQLAEMIPTAESEAKKQATIDSINTIRNLEQSLKDYIADPTNFDKKSKYNAELQTFTDSITRTFGTARSSNIINSYRKAFADPNNPLSWIGSKGAFKGIEEQIMAQSGGYDYKMLGLSPSSDNIKPSQDNQGQGLIGGVENVAGKIANKTIDFLFANTKKFIQDVGKKRQEVYNLSKKDPEAAVKLARKYAGEAMSMSPIIDAIQNKGMAREEVNSALEIATAIEGVGGISKGANFLKSIFTSGAKQVGKEAAGQAGKGGIMKFLKVAADPVGSFSRWKMQSIGENMEKVLDQAGNVKPGSLEKAFGTWQNPNKELLKNTGSLATQTKKGAGGLINILKQEISAQGRGLEGLVKEPSYKDIQSAAIGAGKEGYDVTKATAQNLLKQNIARAYKKILHEEVPEMKKWDDAYKAMKTLEKVSPTISKIIISTIVGVEGFNIFKAVFQPPQQ